MVISLLVQFIITHFAPSDLITTVLYSVVLTTFMYCLTHRLQILPYFGLYFMGILNMFIVLCKFSGVFIFIFLVISLAFQTVYGLNIHVSELIMENWKLLRNNLQLPDTPYSTLFSVMFMVLVILLLLNYLVAIMNDVHMTQMKFKHISEHQARLEIGLRYYVLLSIFPFTRRSQLRFKNVISISADTYVTIE